MKWNLLHKNSIIDSYNECILLNSAIINDEIVSETEDSSEKETVLDMIDSDEFWEKNNYEEFVKSLKANGNSHSAYLSNYSASELRDSHVQTFKLKNYNIGFGLKETEDGNVDIISVHNNSDVHGIVQNLLRAAIRHGGNQLDHFDGKLSDFYKNAGFDEYDRLKFDRQYAPSNWNFERDGEPDVVFRRLKSK